jgi:hypothetical protein
MMSVGMVAVLALVVLSGCGSASSTSERSSASADTASSEKVVPLLRLALPSSRAGCGGARRLNGGAADIPATVSDQRGQVAVLVNVCIAGWGPYPFIVDTGASGTAVDAGLVKRLKLAAVGPPERLVGPGCVTAGQAHRVTQWSIAGLPLAPQTVTAVRIPEIGGFEQPVGVIGSDVWYRFGALRVDFRRGDLVVPGRERGAPNRAVIITRPVISGLPLSLIHGAAQFDAPMTVDASGNGVLLRVPVAFGSHAPRQFIPDMGAVVSVVDSGVATVVGLAGRNQKTTQSTICSVIASPDVFTGTWSLTGGQRGSAAPASHALAPQLVATMDLAGLPGVAGLLGADEMSRFASVVFDYAGGRILFGAH